METENTGAKVEAVMRPVGDFELLDEMVVMFGPRRTMELIGWAVRWTLTGEVEDADAARRHLIKQGMGRSSVYRALADFRRLRDHIDETEGRKVSMREFLTRLGASVPIAGQPVVQSLPTH